MQEFRRTLYDGGAVTLLPTGNSMLPTLRGGRDAVTIRAVGNRKLRRGDVVAYVRNDVVVLHRVLHVKGKRLTIRGDAGTQKEYIAEDQVLGVVETITDTSTERSSRPRRLQGEQAMGFNALRCVVRRYFGRQVRLKIAPWYFVVLALLMWLPLGGVALDNFVLGIRMDHLVHASIYVFCTWFLMDQSWLRRGWQIWLFGVLVCVLTESGQYFLPYRSFDINDMAANFLGVSLGWLMVLRARGFAREK